MRGVGGWVITALILAAGCGVKGAPRPPRPPPEPPPASAPAPDAGVAP